MGSNFYGYGYSQNGAYIHSGRLPQEWAQRLNDTQPTYVITSYGTPIAWVDAAGRVTIPDVKYSTSTTRHQGIAARALTGSNSFRTTL